MSNTPHHQTSQAALAARFRQPLAAVSVRRANMKAQTNMSAVKHCISTTGWSFRTSCIWRPN
ncbi:Uncharacterised protein [Serratia odorifera]|uniref:Uncharacterized protein n=1 Tax=Serratia odorifera TaxID=618 RepID=A0A3S4DPS9_SEROD|nr:Uncharacterised protein [Serratia odorifera]